jgi:hypothetical protein
MPEIRLRRQVRLIYRKTGERSHASSAFLGLLDEKHPTPKLATESRRREVLV